MSKLLNLLSDYGPKILGGKKYNHWEKERFTLQTVEIKNKKLAVELENECKKRGGFLTYSEYLHVEQFGKNGYHATHSSHGFTPSFHIWPKAILQYVKKHSIKSIVELGPGDGKLFHKLVSLAEKENYKFKWYGVEVSKTFQEKIIKRTGNKTYFGGVFETPSSLPQLHKALILSSYCLDSIPPEILVNASPSETIPNNIIGVIIKNGILQEFIPEKNQLLQKGISINNGILKKDELLFDFSDWKLSHMKRLYAHIDSFHKLYQVLNTTKNAHLLIIDEMRESIYESFNSDIVFPPIFLSIKNRHTFTPIQAYARAGELLYYYPIFIPALQGFLDAFGFKNITIDYESKTAREMIGEKWIQRKNVKELCFACTARHHNNIPKWKTFIIPQV